MPSKRMHGFSGAWSAARKKASTIDEGSLDIVYLRFRRKYARTFDGKKSTSITNAATARSEGYPIGRANNASRIADRRAQPAPPSRPPAVRKLQSIAPIA